MKREKNRKRSGRKGLGRVKVILLKIWRGKYGIETEASIPGKREGMAASNRKFVARKSVETLPVLFLLMMTRSLVVDLPLIFFQIQLRIAKTHQPVQKKSNCIEKMLAAGRNCGIL